MKKTISLFTFLFCLSILCVSQIIPPYSTSFETVDNNWSHASDFTQNSNDDWQRGGGTSNYNNPRTGNYAWCTKVNGNAAAGSYYLETPSFDLSSTTETYIFSFYHKYSFQNSGAIEYSIDNGDSWLYLSASIGENENWANNSTFTSTLNSWRRARISLENIQGNANVKFRFSFFANSNSNAGWIIDDFEIRVKENADIQAINGSYTGGQPSNKVNFPILMSYKLHEEFDHQMAKTYIYYSSDTELDAGDLLLDSVSSTFFLNDVQPFLNIGYNVINDNLIQGGLNYIIYRLDVDDELDEPNEDNNIAYAVIDAIPVFDLPYVDDFEEDNAYIVSDINPVNQDCEIPFIRGYGEFQSVSGAHSGEHAWYANNPFYVFTCYQSIQFPFLEMVGDDNVMHFFYKKDYGTSLSIDALNYNNEFIIYQDVSNVTLPEIGKGWKYLAADLGDEFGPVFRLRVGASNGGGGNFAMDDLYIGEKKADILVQHHESIRHTLNGQANDTLFYHLLNCGGLDCPSSLTRFYWSTDSILDGGDVLLGEKVEMALASETEEYTSFAYSKQSQTMEEYFIIAELDVNDDVDEMREYNNSHVFKFYQRTGLSAPYFNDFENQIEQWYYYSDYKSNPIFWGDALSTFPGIEDKVIGIDDEIMPVSNTRLRVHSPVFDLTSMTAPVLRFDLALSDHYSFNGTSFSRMNMEYTTDGGATWNMLEPLNDSHKRWYTRHEWDNDNGVEEQNFFIDDQRYIDNNFVGSFMYNRYYQGRDDDGTEDCIIDIEHLKNESDIQFRFNIGTSHLDDQSKVYIDNFEILEADIDLDIDYVKDLFLSSATSEVELEYHIRNRGNYISPECSMRFYLSEDSLLDATDVLLKDSVMVEAIPPNQRKWFFQALEIPSGTLLGKEYLLFDIDNTNLVSESNEDNNIAFYRSKQEGIQSFPSLFDFNESEVHAWRSYNDYLNLGYFSTGHRYTNRIFYDHTYLNTLARLDGQMNLDRFNPTDFSWPFVYLESPSYDLSQLDSVFISFNFSATTNQSTDVFDQEGINLEYSFDGGNTWNLLGDYQDPNGQNWYSIQESGQLGNEPGWHNCQYHFKTAVYNATDLMAGAEDVTFRFKAKAKHTCQLTSGFKLDNFRLSEEGPLIDLVAVNYGDTIDIEYSGLFDPMDTVFADVLNNSDLFISSNIDFRWSFDSIYDMSDEEANLFYFINSQPNELNEYAAEVSYPYWSCDSMLYLVYRINASFGPSNSVTQVFESNLDNNEGFFLVNLINHDQVLPPTLLNISEDQIICEGESITLEPSVLANYANYNWSDGSSDPTLTITESGEYSLSLTSFFGCSSQTNTVNVEVLENEVEIMYDPFPSFCAGDSLLLSIDEPGSATWSSGQNGASIYAQGAGTYWVNLTNPSGCLSSDTVQVLMDFDLEPSLELNGDGHYCQNFALLETANELFNYQWNTGDSAQAIVIENDGPYFFTTDNACGTYFSDTLEANFYDLIVDVLPEQIIQACDGDTLNLSVLTNGMPIIDWHNSQTGMGNVSNFYDESFFLPNGPVPNNPSNPWTIFSEDLDYTSKISIEGGDLAVRPTGDSIVFQTDYMDVSAYFDLVLRVMVTNEYSDAVNVYYEENGGPLTLFETNGSIGTGVNIVAENFFFETDLLRITVVFNGTNANDQLSQNLRYVRMAGFIKNPQFTLLGSGNNFEHIVNGDRIFLIEADNGFCEEETVLIVEGMNQIFLNSQVEICEDEDELICSNLSNPMDLEITWEPPSAVLNVVDNCALVNSDNPLVLTATVQDGSLCPPMEQIEVSTFTIENTVSQIDSLLTTNAIGSYQWVDCDNGNAPIAGANEQNFIPASTGSYAVEVTTNGCSNLSDCINVVIIGLEDLNGISGIEFYPNPVQNIIIIDSSLPELEPYAIYSLLGERVMNGTIHSGQNQIDLNHLANGTYFLRLGEGQLKIVKVD